MKTKEELNELKEEVETLNEKQRELTDEELEKIHGGAFGSDGWYALCPSCNYVIARGNLIPPTARYCPECNCWVTLNIVYK